jgi:hypothetical protein
MQLPHRRMLSPTPTPTPTLADTRAHPPTPAGARAHFFHPHMLAHPHAPTRTHAHEHAHTCSFTAALGGVATKSNGVGAVIDCMNGNVCANPQQACETCKNPWCLPFFDGGRGCRPVSGLALTIASPSLDASGAAQICKLLCLLPRLCALL